MKDQECDFDQTLIERRFSDFEDLHKRLKKECPNAVRNIKFPRKTILRLTLNESIERGRHLGKYLMFVAHQKNVLKSVAFQHFFFIPHLKEATKMLKCENYKKSYQEYLLAYQLQKKLNSDSQDIIPTMCGVVETSKNLRDFKSVDSFGTECLLLLNYDVSNPYLLPLLHSVIDARRRMHLDVDNLQLKLRECDKKESHDSEIETLRELAVKRY